MDPMTELSSIYGSLLQEPIWSGLSQIVLSVLLLGFWGAPLWAWTTTYYVFLIAYGAPMWVFAVSGILAAIFNVPALRRTLISSGVLALMKKLQIVPAISDTERVALEAGNVWAEADLFSGKPDFKKLMNEPYPQLTAEEKAFIDGPCEKLCEMIDEWAVWQKRDLPPEVWNYIKKEKFLGMIIPKEYGGLGFSALAHSEVIQKLSSRSITGCISVMVPNSLGPAELINHYGTDEQKKYYLPRLAVGDEMPCFALTEPTAGSDAGSITASGEIFRADDGRLMIKLQWNKRWITLASISTILGLAFRLRDPNGLLGKGSDLGITCALVPSNTPGVIIGRRHDPLGVPFHNCPTQGKDVVIPIDQVIGGLSGVGRGWEMLMECLAAGRGVSLPAQSVGFAKLASYSISAYASIRKQFGVPIGKFEGIEEPLARIGGWTYLMEAFRRYTLGALDKGIKPPVVTAMAKYHMTELNRVIVRDAMDIAGGHGISLGPRNIFGLFHIATPISVTVEGANILTRTLIIFGQGALRAHPWAFKEVDAIAKNDLVAFDEAFWGHIAHIVRNACRSFLLSLTHGWLAPSPYGGSVAKYFRRLSWASASFAILADIAMGSLGGALKMREKITGRFADILSWMYINTAVLRRFIAEGQRKEDLPFLHFALGHGFYEIQKAFEGILSNLTVPGLTWFFQGPVRWWGNLNTMGSPAADKHTHKIASLLISGSEHRYRLSEGAYLPKDPKSAVGRMEYAFNIIKRADEAEKKIKSAIRSGALPKLKGAAAAQQAYEKKIISEVEYQDLLQADAVRFDAIQVDDYSAEEYLNRTLSSQVTGLTLDPLQRGGGGGGKGGPTGSSQGGGFNGPSYGGTSGASGGGQRPSTPGGHAAQGFSDATML